MAVNSQFKPTLLAKDLGLKTKDITDLFAGTGINVKTGSVMDTDALDIMWEKLTRAYQVVNIDDYIDGITYIPSAKAAKPETPHSSAAEEDKGGKTGPAADTGKEAAPSAAEKTVSGSGDAADRKEKDGTAAGEAEGKDEGKKPAAPDAAAGAGQASGTAGGNGSAADRPDRDRQREKQGVSRSATERFESRTSAASAMSRDGSKKNDRREKEKEKEKEKNRGGRSGIVIREKTGGTDEQVRVETPASNTRVVDTRGTSNVDLSKYDEKLDSFVSDQIGSRDTRGGAQKGKIKKTSAGEGQDSAQKRGDQGKGRSAGQDSQGGQRSGGRTTPLPDSARRQAAQKSRSSQGGRYQGGGQPAGRQGAGGVKRDQRSKQQTPPQPVKKQPVKAVIPDEITVGEFAQRIKVTAGEVVKRLMMMGMMVTVNQTIDFDTAYLIADELGAEVTKEVVVSIEDRLFEDEKEDSEENLLPRAPVVVVMGHVDHGKTSLLDAIRNTHVTSGEAGGITQHIGAYRVRINGKDITFLDTPGHEAFTAMRARGAKATDIAILVVAADDGIMPQTVEAINHAKAAGVEIIVAINKMDKPGANPEGIKQELTKYDLVPEEWGGDVMCVPVSALKKTGIDDLLESILLIAEVKDYRANPDRRAKGIIIESRLDRGRGPVATVLVQNGTLRPGDIVIAGTCVGRVRAMTDYSGKPVRIAPPSMPVEIVGLDDVPTAGDELNAVEDERMARELAEQRRSKAKEDTFKANSRASLGELFAQIKGGAKDFNIIVKADVGGSAEAVKQSLEKLSNDEVKVHVIHAAAGGITESDVMFAAASNAIIIGFNIRPDRSATESAERQNVEIRTYRIIYECIEEVEAAMKGMLAPKFRESIIGHAEVRQVIHVPNVGFIAGSYVQDGKLTRSALIRVIRDSVVIFEDKVSSLRRFKDDVREVAQGFECGIGLEKFGDLKVGDVLEAFVMEKIEEQQ